MNPYDRAPAARERLDAAARELATLSRILEESATLELTWHEHGHMPDLAELISALQDATIGQQHGPDLPDWLDEPIFARLAGGYQTRTVAVMGFDRYENGTVCAKYWRQGSKLTLTAPLYWFTFPADWSLEPDRFQPWTISD